MAGQGGKGGGVAANPVPKNHSMPTTQGGISQNGVQGYHDPQGNFVPYGGAAPMNVLAGDRLDITTPNLAPTQAMPQPGFNVNNAASTAMQRSMGATDAAMSGPLNVGAFNNPYQQQVIDNTQQDIERQRQMTMNNLGAQAQAAGAFGGSRHGVAEGVTNAEYGRVAANQLGKMRMQGYNTSMANAMNDRTARLNAANQLGGMGNTAFNTGRAINQDLASQGILQQGLQQALIDSARSDFGNYANSPANSLNLPLAALGQAPKPVSQTETTSQSPGLLNTLGALKYLKIF